MKVLDQTQGKDWILYHGDCVEVVKGIPDNSIHYSIHSPPFASLYTYSNSTRDMGNSDSDEQFHVHFRFLVKELYRVLMPGRLLSFHCMNLPTSKARDGFIGIRDFRGELIRMFIEEGWIYHSEVVIWKCPVTAMTRTKALGLLHKQLVKDSAMSRQGIPDYLVTMRKPGDNPEPVSGELTDFVGENPPSKSGNKTKDSINIWQKYASPVWTDINPSKTLQASPARDNKDERHICLAKGTLVLTQQGYKPIEEIAIADLVLTHLGRWKPVIAKQCTGVNPVIHLKAQGVPNLILTPDHKVWTRIAKKNDARQSAMKADPRWVKSVETAGSYVNLKLPPVVEESKYSIHEWKLIGRWLADGHLAKTRRDGIFISCGIQKLETLKLMIGDKLGQIHDTGTAIQLRVKDPDGKLREIIKQCGHGAANKHLPPEAYSLPPTLAKALLDGYLSGDGHYLESRKKWMASSISRELLLGLALIVQRATGSVASVYAGRQPGVTTIEGRLVNTSQDWIMCFNEKKDFSPFVADDGAWKKVRSTNSVGEAETWSLQVEDDASYTAENCIVKNCPLQLQVIERGLQLWTNPGDVVLDPFNGISSTGWVALESGRKYVGVELKESYYKVGVQNLQHKENEVATQLPLFAGLG